jgi:acyl-[acyl-carrier-protein]-phospholipid O-acyltransferase/long-chain-fatty-acid--[acyl-carrier-protein] ligase
MAQESHVSLKNLTVLGKEHLAAASGALILPGQLSYFDLMRLEALLPGVEKVYLVEKGAAHHPLLRVHLEKEGVHAFEVDTHATDAAAYREAIAEATRGGATVIYIPAEASTMSAPLTTVPGTRLEFILRAGVPVLPLYVLQRAEAALPVERRYGDDETIFVFGAPLAASAATLAAYQESLYALSEQAFDQCDGLQLHLAYAALLGLKKHSGTNYVVDGKDEKTLRFDKILAAALALSRVVRRETSQQRVGVILPPGVGGLICNLAVLFAGKIPVNLNFTAGRAAVESAIKRSGIDRFLTADIFVRKMQSFPWPPSKQLILIERVMPKMKIFIGLWLVLSKVLPASLIALICGIPKKGGRSEATLLFTSGSSGDPKGVVLTHRNLMANVIQFGNRLGLKSSDSILACLPLFHSFGCTVTLWYPVIYGLHLVTYPTPLEVKKLAELVEKHRVSLMIATPTFLRGYLRGVPAESLASIKMVVTGAEKLPATVREAFESKFGKPVLEGYGLTETSPVSNVNLPDPAPIGTQGDGHVWLPSHRPGSVGQLLQGLAIRITNPETDQPQPIHQSGMIWFKGANVFDGYLNDEKRTADVIKDGWFRTGDIGRVDLDGFLYIEGRLSRFSKIAGEMVPHETVEEALVKSLGLENESARKLAIVGVPDVDKGEALILLTTLPGGSESQEILDLRYKLLEKGVPPLWIPKKMIRIADIPILSSGKLDVQACEKIARSAAGI